MTTKTVPKEQLRGWVCSLFEFGSDKWFDYESEFMALAKLIEDRAAPPSEPPVSRAYACGCILCICDDTQRCHGCGSKSCGKSDAECDWKQERIIAVRGLQPPAQNAPDAGMPPHPPRYYPYGKPGFVCADDYKTLRAHAESLQRRLDARMTDDEMRVMRDALKSSLVLWEADSRLWPTADTVLKPLIEKLSEALGRAGK